MSEVARWIDISKWNGLFNFQQAVDQGVEGVILRLGSIDNNTGRCYEDYQLRRNVVEAPKHFGPNIGGYWFFRQNKPVAAQVDFTAALLLEFPQIKFLAGDFELAGPADPCREYLGALNVLLPCLVYTSPNAWLNLLIGDKSWGALYKLFLANWYTQNPTIPAPWTDWVIWQYEGDRNGKGVLYGNGPTETGGIEPDIDLDWVDLAWLDTVIVPPLPKVLRVKPSTGIVIRASPNGKYIGLLPRGALLSVSGSTEDAGGKVWYQAGSVWVPATGVEILE